MSNQQLSAEPGQLQSEAAAGVSRSYLYDLDSNLVSQTANFGNSTGTWQYWYDGMDDLVEQSSPVDPNTPGWKRHRGFDPLAA